MDAELVEIRDFLMAEVPYDQVHPAVLAKLPAKLTMRYLRRGNRLLGLGDTTDEVYVLRSGAIDIHDEDGVLRDRRASGATFGATYVLERSPRRHTATTIEDTLLLVFPGEVFRQLCQSNPLVADYFQESRPTRLHSAVQVAQSPEQGEPILRTQVGELARAPAISVSPDTTILQAAQQMSRENASSVLVMKGPHPVGIVTDKDLRNRVVAVGRDLNEPVTSIMTPDPFTTSPSVMAVELLMEMVSRDIRHAPVVTNGKVAGMVSSSDLLRLEHNNPLYLMGLISSQGTVQGLAQVARRLPFLVGHLVRQDASADDIGRVVTGVGDGITRRLLEMVEAELGTPPVPYCWVTLGSQARHEQGLSSDQDHAMIISDEATEEDAPWFLELARKVSDGLVACGYPYCDGDVMATNDAWRVPARQWRRVFERWLVQPEPEALLRSSIFFDMRPLHGELSLFDEVRDPVLAATPKARVFLAHMAKQAVRRRPPIGFFRGFVLESEGEHTDTLDLKRGGVGAVVDLARVYALSVGVGSVNTQARLVAVAEAGRLGRDHAADLRDALEFISFVRLRHQGRMVRKGREPNNFVSPDELSNVEQRHLRDVFQVVRRAQSVLAAQYPLQYIS